MDERNDAFENGNQCCALQYDNECMDIDQTKDNSSQEMLNSSKQLLIFNQSHNSICESHNPFHKLELNIEGLNDIIKSDYITQNNNHIESRDFSIRKSNTNFDTCCASKVHFQQLENNWKEKNLKIMEENQSSTLESMVIDEIHLDCSKDHEMLDYVENTEYMNSKFMKKHIEARTNELESKMQSKCEKIENPKEQSPFQYLHSEVVTKSSSEENVNGFRSYTITPICNDLQDSKTKPKEVEIKCIGEH